MTRGHAMSIRDNQIGGVFKKILIDDALLTNPQL